MQQEKVALQPWRGFVFGATHEMPLRALGYVIAAAAIVDTIPSIRQLQVVHPVYTAERVNGLRARRSLDAALKLRDVASNAVAALHPAVTSKMVYATDSPTPPEVTGSIEAALSGHTDIVERLEQIGASRRSDPYQYVAAHLILHDSNTPIIPFGSGTPIVEPAALVSIGAQSERLFYRARMLCRDHIDIPDRIATTGQLFTRHVLPPYTPCRQGEPGLVEVANLSVDTIHPVDSVQRDLRYIAGRFAEGHHA